MRKGFFPLDLANMSEGKREKTRVLPTFRPIPSICTRTYC
jgi:hypothetical protein